MREGLTFDDVLLVPQYSDITTRKTVNTRTQLSKNIELNIPIVSSNMDTVTEAKMARKMAELGGIGIIHRFLTIDAQAAAVRKVKRAHNFVVGEPYTIAHDATYGELRQAIAKRGSSSFLVVNPASELVGIVTHRDIFFEDDESRPLSEFMTPFEELKYLELEEGQRVNFEEAKALLKKYKLEKLPLINAERKIKGLITAKDIHQRMEFPMAAKDARGRLLVGAAIGVKNDYLERTQALVEAGVDVLVIDIAHGHSKLLLDTMEKVKAAFPEVDLIAGNVATATATRDMISAGADAVKVGIGGGSTCSTRIVTGSGVPQLTAILDCVEVAAASGVPIIADGGIRVSGDIVKSLAAGAHTVMLGGLLAGCEESPGLTRIKDGQKIKIYRGMASYDAAMNRQTAEQGYKVDLQEYVPEGIETVIPYKGQMDEIIHQLIGGLRSGMSYLGAHSVEDMKAKAEFIKMSGAGWHESTPHAKKG